MVTVLCETEIGRVYVPALTFADVHPGEQIHFQGPPSPQPGTTNLPAITTRIVGPPLAPGSTRIEAAISCDGSDWKSSSFGPALPLPLSVPEACKRFDAEAVEVRPDGFAFSSGTDLANEAGATFELSPWTPGLTIGVELRGFPIESGRAKVHAFDPLWTELSLDEVEVEGRSASAAVLVPSVRSTVRVVVSVDSFEAGFDLFGGAANPSTIDLGASDFVLLADEVFDPTTTRLSWSTSAALAGRYDLHARFNWSSAVATHQWAIVIRPNGASGDLRLPEVPDELADVRATGSDIQWDSVELELVEAKGGDRVIGENPPDPARSSDWGVQP
jgi:hypothetical protein